MNGCERFRDLLVLHAESALDEPEHQRVERHLAECEACLQESRRIRAVVGWLSDRALFEPEQDLAWQLLPQKLAARVGETPPVRERFRVRWSSVGWAVTLAASLVLACGLIWMVHRQSPRGEAVAEAAGNEVILNRMESLYAREATVRYLAECQDLLVNLVRAEQSCPESKYDVSLEVLQARELLRKKRMLEAELSLPDVALARGVCDELEIFLVTLSTADDCETSDEVRRMERFIERERLLLRISLLQSELS